MVKRIWFFLLTMILYSASLYAQTAPSRNWYDNLFFHNKSFNFTFINALGFTASGGADIGEAIATAQQIKEGDKRAWYDAWLKTADRTYHFAETMLNSGNAVAAREAFFRASNYYRLAGFYMTAIEDQRKSIIANEKSRQSFSKAISQIKYITTVNIPYERTTLPGYFIQSQRANAPLVIIITGFDGTKEESYFAMGAAAHDRGYNCLLIEGPGQGEVIRTQSLPFRYDWEHVITPVLNYLNKLNVDQKRVALVGISMGGYLAPRASAFDPRIKALIVNGGIYDFGESVYDKLAPDLIALLEKDPHKFNEIIQQGMQLDTEVFLFFSNGMWTFNAKDPADLINKIKPYTLKNVIKSISCPTLVIDSEDETFFKGQAIKFYNALNAPKEFITFTKDQAAQAHCQAGANGISNELIFAWLNKVLHWE